MPSRAAPTTTATSPEIFIWNYKTPKSQSSIILNDVACLTMIYLEIIDQFRKAPLLSRRPLSKLTITVSDNGLSPNRRQAIIWTNAGILFIRPLGINFSEISIEIDIFSFAKMHLKMSSGKNVVRQPSCLGLNVLITYTWLSSWGQIFLFVKRICIIKKTLYIYVSEN